MSDHDPSDCEAGTAEPPRPDETGATVVEYALLASFIAAVIAGVVATLGTKLAALFGPVPGWF